MNSDSPLLQRPDYLVCTCMGVMYSEICQAIQNGSKDFQSLSDQYMIGTGCSSCVSEVNEILTLALKNEQKK